MTSGPLGCSAPKNLGMPGSDLRECVYFWFVLLVSSKGACPGGKKLERLYVVFFRTEIHIQIHNLRDVKDCVLFLVTLSRG